MAKKDFGRKLMPEYLLKYSEELHKNHPDPSAEWGGGEDYTAGYGIDITEGEISVDEEVVALKSELDGYIKNNDSSYEAIFRGQYATVKADGAYTSTTYADGTIGRSLPYGVPGYTYTLPDKTGTFAMTSDIITSYNDLTDKPTLATVATTGDYDDLLNKPTIPTVDYPVTDVQVDGVSVVSNKVASITMPTVPTKVSDLQNDSGFITASALSGYATETWVENKGYLTSVSWNDVSNKPTFATVATSGDYDDLINKPTIPAGATTPFLRVTDANDAVYFSLNGAAGTFYKWLDVSNEIVKVNLQALNPVFGSGLTSTYNTSTNQLDVAIDTTTVAMKTDIPTVPVTDVQVNGTSVLSGTVASVSVPTSATSTSTSTSTVTPTTETLIFTLSDNSTVTVNVMTGATVATTTTTTTTLS